MAYNLGFYNRNGFILGFNSEPLSKEAHDQMIHTINNNNNDDDDNRNSNVSC